MDKDMKVFVAVLAIYIVISVVIGAVEHILQEVFW